MSMVKWNKLPPESSVAIDMQFAADEMLVYSTERPPWNILFINPRKKLAFRWGGMSWAWWDGIVWVRETAQWSNWPYDCPDCRVGNIPMLISIRCPECGRVESQNTERA